MENKILLIREPSDFCKIDFTNIQTTAWLVFLRIWMLILFYPLINMEFFLGLTKVSLSSGGHQTLDRCYLLKSTNHLKHCSKK